MCISKHRTMGIDRLIFICCLISVLSFSVVAGEIEPRYDEKLQLTVTSTVSSFDISINLVIIYNSKKLALIRIIKSNKKRS